MQISCPKCQRVLSVPDDAAGEKGQCPHCGQKLRVPPSPKMQTVLAQPYTPRQNTTLAIPPPSPLEVVAASPSKQRGCEMTPRKIMLLVFGVLGCLGLIVGLFILAGLLWTWSVAKPQLELAPADSEIVPQVSTTKPPRPAPIRPKPVRPVR